MVNDDLGDIPEVRRHPGAEPTRRQEDS
jgi:hypothetical protein